MGYGTCAHPGGTIGRPCEGSTYVVHAQEVTEEGDQDSHLLLCSLPTGGLQVRHPRGQSAVYAKNGGCDFPGGGLCMGIMGLGERWRG